MTLVELLVAVSLMGLVTAVVSAAIVVTLRQTNATEGRTNLAAYEQSIDTWIPADLSSTDVTADFEALYGAAYAGLLPVNTAAGASPCGNCGSLDLSGANALQLAWFTAANDGTPVLTQVQYQYIETGSGQWQLQRIACVGDSPCTKAVVLRDLAPPPDLATYNPDLDRPTWILSTPELDDPADLALATNAQRIVVTINGGGAGGSTAGGTSSVSLTAGGVLTSDIAADDFTVPSFIRAKSRCGGPVTLIVDDSGSIGGAVSTVVEPGVVSFIEAFRGTPTQVQVVQFSSDAQAIGPGSGWHRYIDMTNDADVDQLKTDVVAALDSNGGTNWEEAFFHTLKESDGTTATMLPNRIVFFTDGIPTRNRTSRDRGWWDTYSNGTKNIHYNDGSYRTAGSNAWPMDNGTAFNQESYDRADVILDDHRGIDLIFVGVGPDLNNNVSWIYNEAVYANHNADRGPTSTKKAHEVIAGLLTNLAYNEVDAVFSGGEYTNPEVANFYLQSSFDEAAFGAAMKASALKDCGGTLTIQTRLPDGTPVADEFVYENSEYRTDDGTPVDAESRVVTTSATFRTGTFDFDIPGSTAYYSVDVVPQELQTLEGYDFGDWSCRAGATAKSTIPVVISGSAFEGVTVDVAANEAVSCILTVVPT